MIVVFSFLFLSTSLLSSHHVSRQYRKEIV